MSGPLDLPIAGLQFTPASPPDRARGLLGFLAFDHGGLRIDGVAVRRTLRGRVQISYPERLRRGGGSYPIVRPLDAATRRALEERILDALAPQLAALEREERDARRAGGSR